MQGKTSFLVLDDGLHPFQGAGYGAKIARPKAGQVTVLTPAPMLDVLRAGYRPVLHQTAGLSAGRSG